MTEPRILGRDDILSANDAKTEIVSVPEWGGSVIVKALNGEERDRYETSITIQRKGDISYNLENARAKLVVLSVVDEDGKQLFTQQDIRALGRKSSAALQRVFLKARELSGLSDDDMEEMVGNSSADQDGSSTSA